MNNNKNLLEQFVRLEWLLRRYHLQNLRNHGPMGDPHRGQGRVLALLKLKPEISQKELSDILDIRSQSLGELLVKLERSGYITRTPSATDRRVMDIRLTEAGRGASVQNEKEPDTEGLFGCLNEEEQSALSDYLGRITSTLEQQFGNSSAESHFHGRPPFDGRAFAGHPHMEDFRPPFGRRGFAGHPDEGKKPNDSNEE